MTLFDYTAKEYFRLNAPLAARMRPAEFDEFVGQEEIIGPDKILRKSIDADKIPSIILWGPSGSGKTTLANLIAEKTQSNFIITSAVNSNVAEIRTIIRQAEETLSMYQKRTILFIDEIHRFNKSQQDVILPHVEDGTITLIGATTENPSFEVNTPLLSRTRIFLLRPLEPNQVKIILERAVSDKERGLGQLAPSLNSECLEKLVILSNGDARTALNALELATIGTKPDSQGKRNITTTIVEEAMQQKHISYDNSGDQHFDTISAFIKSIRGSDPDAAIYWLARMIKAGEDPMFIARRLVILANEDIGMADPKALMVAVSAQQALHLVGMPEGRIPLANATIYLSTAHKSNRAYLAITKALEDVDSKENYPVPLHLRNASTELTKDLGYGKDYKYAHDFDNHFVSMENLPINVKGSKYYKPSNQGAEKEISKRLKELWDKEST